MVVSATARQMLWWIIRWMLVILGLGADLAKSKIIQGELRTKENWIFLTRFCFLSERGRFEYEVQYPREFMTQSILLYYDERNQWPAVYKTNKTCTEKESVLSIRNGQVIFLNETTRGSGCFAKNTVADGDNIWLHCDDGRTFESARERWWFVAISNCNSKKGLHLKYRILMTNHNSDIWQRHFSADEMYILQVDICFLILYLILLLASLFEAHILRSRHLLHRTYVLYVASVILECSGLAFLCASYALYAQDGSVNPAYKLLGKIMESVSTLLLLVLLLLIAKGYTVTRGRLKHNTVVKIAMIMCFYVLFYAALFLYEQMFFDPAKVLYLYESPAGYGIIGLRVIGWSWFVYATIFTMIHYPEKSNFYTRMFLLYSLWFLSAPVVILISTFIVPKWMREKILNGVELFISIKAHFIFFVLTRPSMANKNFPFHVRTTQIDVMRLTNGIAGDSTIDRFSHHPYAVSANYCQSADYASLFGVRAIRTENAIEMLDQRVNGRDDSRMNGHVNK